ncbi:hypothetical protein PRIPAC_93781 [Pristionchus pacificus]|uniref:Metallopeptidase n=1 Tax=Pristionchus pacificus TaxID=54126 RepID=A0A2A6CDC2_PRIPA|nr:hypothetical protein PRIPAC_93781 [Pristionchus pacificus]|eukprot:PDM76202.1 metallopeptidase [Pristionchus pacificus]
MCGQMGHLTRLCKQQTACKVIAKDHTEEKVIAQHDFSEETWREFKKSQCATKNSTPSRPRSARPEIIRSHGEDFSAEISSSFIIRSSFGAHEAKPNGKDHTEEKVIGKDHTVEKVINEMECETEGFRDHKAPAVIEKVKVKVREPEAKVKVREPEAKESNLVKFHESVANDNMTVKVRRPEANANEKKMEYSLQNRQYSDKVKRESPETTTIEESNCNERIDIGRTDTEGSPAQMAARFEGTVIDRPSIADINKPIVDYLYIGDVMLSPEDLRRLDIVAITEGKRGKRGAPIVTSTRWTKTQPIGFVFASDIDAKTQTVIRTATQKIAENTCLSFKENSGVGTQLQFYRGGGCFSFLGQQVGSFQKISIDMLRKWLFGEFDWEFCSIIRKPFGVAKWLIFAKGVKFVTIVRSGNPIIRVRLSEPAPIGSP